MNVEPFINLSWIRLHTDSFREDGGAAALSVRNETMNTFYSTLGMRGVTELPKNVNLYGSLGWQHAYGDKNTSSRMAFAGSDAFITQGQAVDEDVMVGDIGVSVQLSRAATLDVGYQGNSVKTPASIRSTLTCVGRSDYPFQHLYRPAYCGSFFVRFLSIAS